MIPAFAGMTVPYAEVIGDPIAHSKSPLIHKFWLEKLGLDGDYRAVRVSATGLDAYIADRLLDPHWRGCNVTIPHKEAAAKLANRTVAPASVVGAVNCLVREGDWHARLVGHNSDVVGFAEPVAAYPLRSMDGLYAHVIGTGGAAAAVTYALARLGFTIFNYGRTREKADAFRHRLGKMDDNLSFDWSDLRARRSVLSDDDEAVEMIVNATPMGMRGYDALPLNLDDWSRRTIVYDLVYSPLQTPLLQEARRRGMDAIDGLQMLVGQAARAFELFFEVPAPRQHDAELRALLTL